MVNRKKSDAVENVTKYRDSAMGTWEELGFDDYTLLVVVSFPRVAAPMRFVANRGLLAVYDLAQYRMGARCSRFIGLRRGRGNASEK
jgi:hypothetical protein